MADRIRVKDVAKRLAQSVRKIQEMAVRGELPSAVKIGAIWTFDPDSIDAWLKKLEVKSYRKAAAKELIPRQDSFRPQPMFDVSAYERAIFGPQGRAGPKPRKRRAVIRAS